MFIRITSKRLDPTIKPTPNQAVMIKYRKGDGINEFLANITYRYSHTIKVQNIIRVRFIC